MALCIDTLSAEDRRDFYRSFDTVLTDCDGVLWFLDNALPGAVEVINGLKADNKRVFFITNSNKLSTDQLLEKFHRLGFQVTADEVFSTSLLAAKYLNDNLDPSKKAYVIGSPGIARELDKMKVQHFGVGPDYMQCSLPSFVEGVKLESDVGAVLVGFDEHLSYPKLFKAASYLNDRNVLFVATNTDERFPVPGTDLVKPGTGIMVKAVQTSAGRPPVLLGKPSSYLRDVLMETNKIDPPRTLMIGDRCNTDILFGKRCGFKTLLVLSGANSLEEVNEWNKSSDPEINELVPDYYAKGINSLKTFLAPL